MHVYLARNLLSDFDRLKAPASIEAGVEVRSTLGGSESGGVVAI